MVPRGAVVAFPSPFAILCENGCDKTCSGCAGGSGFYRDRQGGVNIGLAVWGLISAGFNIRRWQSCLVLFRGPSGPPGGSEGLSWY